MHEKVNPYESPKVDADEDKSGRQLRNPTAAEVQRFKLPFYLAAFFSVFPFFFSASTFDNVEGMKSVSSLIGIAGILLSLIFLVWGFARVWRTLSSENVSQS